MEATHVLETLKRRTSTLNTIVMIVTPVAFIIGGIIWYEQNIWQPKVSVTSVDWVAGTANLVVNGKEKLLYQGSTQNAGFNWGVRFAGENNDRLELVKNDLTYKILSKK